MKSILLIEDDENLGNNLVSYLNQYSFNITWSKTLTEARTQVASTPRDGDLDMVLLDWMLPDGEGVDFLKELRADNPSLPVIMLTARADTIDKVVGLECGADDYLTKPFEPRELLARMRARIRAMSAVAISEKSGPSAQDLEINVENRWVKFRGEMVTFAKKEFDVLSLMSEHPMKVFSRDELLNKVWGFEHFPTTRTVDTHILQLRQKLDDCFFETVRGIGYRFNPEKLTET